MSLKNGNTTRGTVAAACLCLALARLFAACGADDGAGIADGGDTDTTTDTGTGGDADAGPDGGALTVEAFEPADGAVVRMNQKIVVRFSPGAAGDHVDPATVAILVDGAQVDAREYYAESQGNREFHFVPFPVWTPGETHEVVVAAGAAYAGDPSRALAEELSWSFTVEDAPLEETYDEAATPALSDDELAAMAGGEPDAGAFLESDLVKDWTDPESGLYEVSIAVQPDDPDVAAFADKMLASLNPLSAVGLAAPQFGVGRRLFVADVNGERRAFVNPRVDTWSDDLYFGSPEGCLSIDGVSSIVGRPASISVEFDTPEGDHVTGYTLQNYGAKVWLHEYDHLDGVLMTDREERRSW